MSDVSFKRKLEFKQLERGRCFLLHIVMTYRTVNLYLKSKDMHHSIDSLRPNRKEGVSRFLSTIEDEGVREKYINSHNIGHLARIDPEDVLITQDMLWKVYNLLL